MSVWVPQLPYPMLTSMICLSGHNTGVLDEGAEYAFANGARLTVESGCTFNGNVAKGSEKTSILDIGPLHQTLAESEWQGATITYQA